MSSETASSGGDVLQDPVDPAPRKGTIRKGQGPYVSRLKLDGQAGGEPAQPRFFDHDDA
jgi:hypothetical protein